MTPLRLHLALAVFATSIAQTPMAAVDSSVKQESATVAPAAAPRIPQPESQMALDGVAVVRASDDPFKDLPKIRPLPPRQLTADEVAVQAMIPFALFGALLVICALGVVRLIRAVRNMRSESIVRRLREARASKESRERAAERAAREAQQQALTRWELSHACREFNRAARNHFNQPGDRLQFESIKQCVDLIPELVHERWLEADDARKIEQAIQHCVIASDGQLRTEWEEQDRAAYLDGQGTPAPTG